MKKQLFFTLMLLAAIGIAVAAPDLDTYPNPFIDGGRFTAQVIVGAAAPSTDVLAATEIAVSLQQKSDTKVSAQLMMSLTYGRTVSS